MATSLLHERKTKREKENFPTIHRQDEAVDCGVERGRDVVVRHLYSTSLGLTSCFRIDTVVFQVPSVATVSQLLRRLGCCEGSDSLVQPIITPQVSQAIWVLAHCMDSCVGWTTCVCVGVCVLSVCLCVRACVRACVLACLRACVRLRACVLACLRACVLACLRACVFGGGGGGGGGGVCACACVFV